MNRLTMKIKDGFYAAPNIVSTDDLKYKLGKIYPLEIAIAFNLLNKEIVIDVYGKYNKGRVLDIRKDGVFCIHYFNETLGYDDIEPLSNYCKTFWLKDNEV